MEKAKSAAAAEAKKGWETMENALDLQILRDLKMLYDDGVLTAAEFAAKKAEILGIAPPAAASSNGAAHGAASPAPAAPAAASTPRGQSPNRGALIAPCSFNGMIDMEIICLNTPRDKPSDEGVAKDQFSRPAGETVKKLLAWTGVENTELGKSIFDQFVCSLVLIDEDDVDFEGAAVTLNDVITHSSRLFLRPRVDGADSAFIFMYAADGDSFVPMGGQQFDALAALGLGEVDCYDCAMTLAKQFSEHSVKCEGPKANALQLVNSKPSRKDLEFFVLSEYSATKSLEAIFRECLQSDRRYWVRVDASAKLLEIIEPLRGRRACHVIFLRPARSAGDARAAKPPPLSLEIVDSAITAVMASDAPLEAALVDGTLTAEMLLTAVAAHLKEADGGARLKSEYGAVLTKCVTVVTDLANDLAHQVRDLKMLYDEGGLTAAEFAAKKAIILGTPPPAAAASNGAASPAPAAPAAASTPPELDEPAAESPSAPELLTGAAGLLQILDEFKIKNGGVDDPYYAAMRGALEELVIEERGEGS